MQFTKTVFCLKNEKNLKKILFYIYLRNKLKIFFMWLDIAFKLAWYSSKDESKRALK